MRDFKTDLVWMCDRYRMLFGQNAPAFDQALIEVTTTALESISQSDAPYHTLEQTLQVMKIGQLILEGKQHYDGDVSPRDWLQFLAALSCQNIGYVKGVFERDDHSNYLYYDGKLGFIKLFSRATGAALSECHVDRSKAYVAINLIHPQITVETVQEMIEMTRFPIPHQSKYQHKLNYPGLCRAADLLGQICDLDYLQKLPALFQEFEEIGMNRALGYTTPADLQDQYPYFFWQVIYPYVKGSMRYLSATVDGRRAIAQLYTNVCMAELNQPPADARVPGALQVDDEARFLPWQEAGFLFFS
ncbi:MAG: metal-dependent phosphohydrolase [Leptolyngbya sp. SIOISBB]|nr:metal-dependent phosphohydrolase [Leptolyngbya sp. SIOISBB]